MGYYFLDMLYSKYYLGLYSYHYFRVRRVVLFGKLPDQSSSLDWLAQGQTMHYFWYLLIVTFHNKASIIYGIY